MAEQERKNENKASGKFAAWRSFLTQGRLPSQNNWLQKTTGGVQPTQGETLRTAANNLFQAPQQNTNPSPAPKGFALPSSPTAQSQRTQRRQTRERLAQLEQQRDQRRAIGGVGQMRNAEAFVPRARRGDPRPVITGDVPGLASNTTERLLPGIGRLLGGVESSRSARVMTRWPKDTSAWQEQEKPPQPESRQGIGVFQNENISEINLQDRYVKRGELGNRYRPTLSADQLKQREREEALEGINPGSPDAPRRKGAPPRRVAGVLKRSELAPARQQMLEDYNAQLADALEAEESGNNPRRSERWRQQAKELLDERIQTLQAASRDVRAKGKKDKYEGDPAEDDRSRGVLGPNTEPGTELSPYGSVEVMRTDARGTLVRPKFNPQGQVIQETDEQNRKIPFTQTIWPAEGGYSVIKNPDATAAWDLQEELSTGRLAARANDAVKTPVIGWEGLRLAQERGLFRLASPEEAEEYASAGKSGSKKNTLFGFLVPPGDRAKPAEQQRWVPVYDPNLSTDFDVITRDSEGREVITTQKQSLYRIGSPINRDDELLRRELIGYDIADPGSAIDVRTGRPNRQSLRKLTRTPVIPGTAVRTKPYVQDVGKVLQALQDYPGMQIIMRQGDRQEAMDVAGLATLFSDMQQGIASSEERAPLELYLKRPDGTVDRMMPFLDPEAGGRLRLAITNPREETVVGPAFLSERSAVRKQAERLAASLGVPSQLSEITREIAALGFSEGAPVTSRESVVRRMLNLGLKPRFIMALAAASNVPPEIAGQLSPASETELRYLAQALVSAQNKGRPVDLFADSAPIGGEDFGVPATPLQPPPGQEVLGAWRNPDYRQTFPQPRELRRLERRPGSAPAAMEFVVDDTDDLQSWNDELIAEALAEERAMREERARAEDPTGFGYAQFGDGAVGDGEEGTPGESKRVRTKRVPLSAQEDRDRRAAGLAMKAMLEARAGRSLQGAEEVRGVVSQLEPRVVQDLRDQARLIADAARREASATERVVETGERPALVTEMGASDQEVLARALRLARGGDLRVRNPVAAVVTTEQLPESMVLMADQVERAARRRYGNQLSDADTEKARSELRKKATMIRARRRSGQ